MKLKPIVFLMLVVFIAGAAVILPAFASHGYTINNVQCIPSDNKIIVFGVTSDEPIAGYWVDVFVEGNRVGEFHTADTVAVNGPTQDSFSHPAIVEGAEIQLVPIGGRAGTNFLCRVDDGRINTDFGAPVAVYLDSIDVFGIDPASGAGNLDIRISDEQIDAVGIPSQNTLLAEGVNSFTGQPISVWRLATGEFQLNTAYSDGKPYIITWETDGANLVYLAS